jgi:hypothetical protein
MRLILSCTGVLVIGVTGVARERGRERERKRESVRVACLVCPASLRSPYVNVLRQRPPPRALGRPWTSPFIDSRRCPAVQWGVAMCYHGWRRSALSPVRVLTCLSEECLEPYRSIAGGVAWILLMFPCFRRRLGAIRRHGRMRGTIITCYGVTLDGTPVLFLHSLRHLARSRVMMYPL